MPDARRNQPRAAGWEPQRAQAWVVFRPHKGNEDLPQLVKLPRREGLSEPTKPPVEDG